MAVSLLSALAFAGGVTGGAFAAAGLFDQARQVRADLQRLHPSENMAISAANRALQAADLPAAKAAEQPASPPQR